MDNNSFFELHNGVIIPSIGFGTWQIPDGEMCYNAVSNALRSGYRHIDTAKAYNNEKSVGRAVKDSGLRRNEVFITSKLPAEIKSYDGAWENFNQTMENLGTEYLDLYLVHAPWPWAEIGKDCTKENISVWKAMEEIYKSGRCRAIGVSNFNVKDLNAIMDNGQIKPMANQIKYYIGNIQEEIVDFCLKNDILVEGYSPLATGKILGNYHIKEIADKYRTSVSKICIRYVLQKGVLPLPKSVTPERIQQNFDISFTISGEDMKDLDSLKETIAPR